MGVRIDAIGYPISVQVCYYDRTGRQTRREGSRSGKRAIASTQQDRDIIGAFIGDGEIRHAITVEVCHRHRKTFP
jgi:hypothetical protein